MASYKGNIGIMELIQFNKLATPAEKAKMDELLKKNDPKAVWKLVQRVTKTKLVGKEFN